MYAKDAKDLTYSFVTSTNASMITCQLLITIMFHKTTVADYKSKLTKLLNIHITTLNVLHKSR